MNKDYPGADAGEARLMHGAPGRSTRSIRFALLALVGALLATGGYWLGQRQPAPASALVSASANASANASASTSPSDQASQDGAKTRKLLYYRNPMGLPDTSPTPKKDPMGMDYIAVYAGEENDNGNGAPAAAGQINISTEKIQKLGVRSEAAQRRVLDKIVRAAGRIEPDERLIYAIAPKFEGYVERLHVNVTGQHVGKGQALFEVYSPDLVSAQREYALAAHGVDTLNEAGSPARAGMQELAEASLQRLKNWDISGEQIKALSQSGQSRRTLTLRSPVAGIVTEKKAVQGMRFSPGEALYQITDLSSVWVIADVFEQDIGLLTLGAKASVRINAYPDKLFSGRVSYIYPTLNAATRTIPVRLDLANPGLLLKPSMFAQVELPVAARGEVITIPNSAVIDSGSRQVVLLQLGEGRFEPRAVKLGARSDNYVEVIEGLKDGERVVVAANFLIDAESNLKAALGGFAKATAEAPGEKKTAPTVGHHAAGRVDSLDLSAGTISLEHGPVASLKWPAMTMEFKLANPALASTLKPGAQVAFEFVERAPGEWVITALKPTVPTAHAGH